VLKGSQVQNQAAALPIQTQTTTQTATQASRAIKTTQTTQTTKMTQIPQPFITMVNQ